MKSNYVRFITFAAFAAILFLQGLWLYNTYKLLETEFKNNITSLFINSLEKEALLRADDPGRKPKEKNIYEARLDDDRYNMNRAIQDWLYREGFSSISLENVDNIFKEGIKNNYEHFNCNFRMRAICKNRRACRRLRRFAKIP